MHVEMPRLPNLIDTLRKTDTFLPGGSYVPITEFLLPVSGCPKGSNVKDSATNYATI